MNHTDEDVHQILSTFRPPDWAAYPKLADYSRDDLHRDFFSGGSLYLSC
jgi:hypothetical protein